jgi:LPS export ABC transporter protein LptC
MINRNRKLRFIQFILLIFGLLIIYLTYYNKTNDDMDKIVSETLKKSVEESSPNNKETFSNIEYTGLDLNGNRYLLKSEEAYLDEINKEIVHMLRVDATFYFKDNTRLFIEADEGNFNNKTLDMMFKKNVEADYLDSKLFAEKAEYLNTENSLKVYENVRIKDKSGDLIADKLVFDITSQELNITSFANGKINANLNLNEKRF